jgi:hypothetical protein
MLSHMSAHSIRWVFALGLISAGFACAESSDADPNPVTGGSSAGGKSGGASGAGASGASAAGASAAGAGTSGGPKAGAPASGRGGSAADGGKGGAAQQAGAGGSPCPPLPMCVADASGGGARCGSRGQAACPADQYCEFPAGSACGAADGGGACQQRPDACDAIYQPVCGCDAKTYGNACEAAIAGVSVESSGEC